MISVVGGTYIELCKEPEWKELYGSGLRAAIGISKLSDEIKYYSFAEKYDIEEIQHKSNALNFKSYIKEINETFSFTYQHPLSIPIIYPSLDSIQEESYLEVKDENILQFGTIEGKTVVHGNWVVYDPQSPNDPKHFNENGSTAEHLAIVLNSSEGKKLTSKETPQEIGSFLITNHNYEVVIVKDGSNGAFVVTKGGLNSVPVYLTTSVFPIGSGDIFSSVFAHFWAEKKISPLEAAGFASLYTAFYCQNTSLPLPTDLEFDPTPLKVLNSSKKVYLASPLFSMAQKWLIEETRNALLQHGFNVFSPLHDVGLGNTNEIVDKDLRAIENSQIVFAILDGLDTGTIFEIGYARAKGIPVVVFVQNESDKNLLMLKGSGCKIFKDFTTAIYQTTWTLNE